MSVYMIIQSTIKNAEKYRQYIDQVFPMVKKYGGRYHVRGENIKALSDWNPDRMVVIEFPSEDHINEWLTSPEYTAVAPLRKEGANTQAVIVEGC